MLSSLRSRSAILVSFLTETYPCRTHQGTFEDQLRHPKTVEVCLSVSNTGCGSPSRTRSNPEPNRLLQCRLCRLATAQYQPTFLSALELGALLSSYLEGALYKFLNE